MKRVLIVEDSPAMRDLLALAVRRQADVVIDHASDGVAALKQLKTSGDRIYDLIFLDVNMPMMDGMKLLGKLKTDPIHKKSVVCMVTTEESAETEQQAWALGAKYFIRKPVNRQLVEQVVAEVFES